MGDFSHRNVAGACVALVTLLVPIGWFVFILMCR